MSPPQEWLEQPVESKPEQQAYHFLAPWPMVEAFQQACRRKRWSQGDCLEEAIRALLKKHGENGGPGEPPILPTGRYSDVVCRPPRLVVDAMRGHAKVTRIRLSDLMREAVNDWLAAQDAAPWLRPEASSDEPPKLRAVP